MSAPTAETLLDALGRDGARPVMERFWSRGPVALDELLRALADDHPRPASEGEKRNGRAFHEELEETLYRLARAHPDHFVERLHEVPSVLKRFEVLSGVGAVVRPETTKWLVDALSDRSGSNRWLALSALIRRQAPEVRARLGDLLRDRDSLVRFEAVGGLRRWGQPEHVEPLRKLAAKATIGARWLAEDAIESICARNGVELPDDHPGPRLVEVPIPDGEHVEVVASSALQRRAGEALATVDRRAVASSPCDGVVVAIDGEPDGSGRRVVLRKMVLAD